MLTIKITHGNPDGSLKLKVNGFPNNGRSKAEKGSEVQWKVKKNCNVAYIDEIKMKTGIGAPPSTDIFSNDPPRPQGGPNSKDWKASINLDASDFAEYHYDIKWMPTENKGIQVYDPIISVKPSNKFLLIIIGFVLSLFALFSIILFRRKGK